MAKAKRNDTTTGQAKRFGLVGLLNTAIDFILFQAITKIFSIPLDSGFISVAKQVSGTAAMINSFFFNRAFVFHKADSHHAGNQALRFLATTAVGVYVIQAGLTFLFTSQLPQLGEFAYDVVTAIKLNTLPVLQTVLTEPFMIKTVAFGMATVASMTWNFLLYKLWAFRD